MFKKYLFKEFFGTRYDSDDDFKSDNFWSDISEIKCYFLYAH